MSIQAPADTQPKNFASDPQNTRDSRTFSFVITCWQGDAYLAARVLDNLERIYPHCYVLLILDGKVEEKQLKPPRALNLIIHQGESLALAKYGGAWAQRYMHLSLEHLSEDIIIKLDPDVRMVRPFKPFPHGDVFGRLSFSPLGTLVYGGCRGHRRVALERIVQSRLLLRPYFQNLGYTRFSSHRHEGEADQEQVYQDEDGYLISVFKSLRLHLEDWSDVQVRFRPAYPLEEISDAFAVWHPVLEL